MPRRRNALRTVSAMISFAMSNPSKKIMTGCGPGPWAGMKIPGSIPSGESTSIRSKPTSASSTPRSKSSRLRRYAAFFLSPRSICRSALMW